MLDKITIGENEEVGATVVKIKLAETNHVFYANDVEKAINYACGQVIRNFNGVDATAEKPTFKYEEVTDLSVSEKAKAMIDGEVFYSDDGKHEYSFDSVKGEFFIRNANNATIVGIVSSAGVHYRKIETQWHDKLDGTMENAVLCWVSDADQYIRGNIAIISEKDKRGYKQHGPGKKHWNHATRISKDELSILIANAQEGK